ncbi:MAG TPA: hypothetical protein VNK43_02935 [Gemmatimonadales bacterium]|nr:hypothetical protein [Gemmatimonadales bacterium]
MSHPRRLRVPRDRAGRSALGCLVSLAIFAGAVYYGVNIGEVFFRYYQLRDEMRVQARLAPSVPDATIRRRLMAKVDALGLPEEANKFKIRRSARPRVITIETTYRETVDLPLFRHTFILTPRAEEPL